MKNIAKISLKKIFNLVGYFFYMYIFFYIFWTLMNVIERSDERSDERYRTFRRTLPNVPTNVPRKLNVRQRSAAWRFEEEVLYFRCIKNYPKSKIIIRVVITKIMFIFKQLVIIVLLIIDTNKFYLVLFFYIELKEIFH